MTIKCLFSTEFCFLMNVQNNLDRYQIDLNQAKTVLNLWKDKALVENAIFQDFYRMISQIWLFLWIRLWSNFCRILLLSALLTNKISFGSIIVGVFKEGHWIWQNFVREVDCSGIIEECRSNFKAIRFFKSIFFKNVVKRIWKSLKKYWSWW